MSRSRICLKLMFNSRPHPLETANTTLLPFLYNSKNCTNSFQDFFLFAKCFQEPLSFIRLFLLWQLVCDRVYDVVHVCIQHMVRWSFNECFPKKIRVTVILSLSCSVYFFKYHHPEISCSFIPFSISRNDECNVCTEQFFELEKFL